MLSSPRLTSGSDNCSPKAIVIIPLHASQLTPHASPLGEVARSAGGVIAKRSAGWGTRKLHIVTNAKGLGTTQLSPKA